MVSTVWDTIQQVPLWETSQSCTTWHLCSSSRYHIWSNSIGKRTRKDWEFTQIRKLLRICFLVVFLCGLGTSSSAWHRVFRVSMVFLVSNFSQGGLVGLLGNIILVVTQPQLQWMVTGLPMHQVTWRKCIMLLYLGNLKVKIDGTNTKKGRLGQ